MTRDLPRVGAGLSTLDDPVAAVREAARAARDALDGAPADLAFVFVTAHHLAQVDVLAGVARAMLGTSNLVGCVAEGVLAGRSELEDGAGAAVWAASLPGAAIELFHVEGVDTDEGVAFAGFPQLADPALVALLADPYTFPADPFLAGLNHEYPGLPLVGGFAAGGGRQGLQALLLGSAVHRAGAVGAVVSGTPVRTVVSQGCRPIGHDLTVTGSHGNVVLELAGKPAIERLREQVEALPETDRRKALRGLTVGLVIDENVSEYGRGDYLVRGLLGGDEESGALLIGEAVRVGQTLRFHIRDAATADEDLREALAAALEGAQPAGALLFTCNGRGASLFGQPDHDAALVSDALGGGGVAGFFCGGEIGPVGAAAFTHAFTATIAVFLQAEPG